MLPFLTPPKETLQSGGSDTCITCFAFPKAVFNVSWLFNIDIHYHLRENFGIHYS